MTAIKSFTKSNLPEVRAAIDAALLKVKNQYGIELSIGNISFNSGEFTTKLQGRTGDANVLVSALGPKFARYGLPTNSLSRRFTYEGKEWEIIDVDTKKRTSPIIIRNVKTGARAKCSAELVRSFLV